MVTPGSSRCTARGGSEMLTRLWMLHENTIKSIGRAFPAFTLRIYLFKKALIKSKIINEIIKSKGFSAHPLLAKPPASGYQTIQSNFFPSKNSALKLCIQWQGWCQECLNGEADSSNKGALMRLPGYYKCQESRKKSLIIGEKILDFHSKH